MNLNPSQNPSFPTSLALDTARRAVEAIEHANNTPERIQRNNTMLSLVAGNQDAAILIAYDRHSPTMPLAVGTATKSIHDYSNCGINLLSVRNRYEYSEPVQELVNNLIRYTEDKQRQTILVPGTQEEVKKYPSQYHALSVGTNFPELFVTHGFQPIHSHQDDRGNEIVRLNRINHPECSYSTVDFSQPIVFPEFHSNVRLLNTQKDIDDGAAIVAEEWGEDSAQGFREEFSIIKNTRGSGFYGVFSDGELRGIGAICKGLHHEEAWSRAWIVVSTAHRGAGLAQQLIQGLNAHADLHHPQFSDGPVVMEGFTYIPDYYRKFGNMPTAQCVGDNPKRPATWTVRITPNPRDTDLSRASIRRSETE